MFLVGGWVFFVTFWRFFGEIISNWRLFLRNPSKVFVKEKCRNQLQNREKSEKFLLVVKLSTSFEEKRVFLKPFGNGLSFW